MAWRFAWAAAKALWVFCSSCCETTPDGASASARALFALAFSKATRAASIWSGRSEGRTTARSCPFFTRSPRSTSTASR